jgi:SAM-dependent methyltransferase
MSQATVDIPEARTAKGATALASVLRELHCPYCGSDLALEWTATPDYGLLRCACHTYPIVDGIPIVQQVERLETLTDLVRRNEPQRALLQALKLFRVKWALKSRWHKFVYRMHSGRLVARDDLTFEDAVGLVRQPQGFADYLLHRYANPSFLATAGLLQLLGTVVDRNATLAGRPARVLDMGCGAGHCSFLMRHLYPGLSVVATDHDFVSVYLAKRFVARDAIHLCVDAEAPSPFADDSFDAVFCLDAFHYLRTKKAIVRELSRVADADALWLFPHLHNALQHNVVAGIPMSPEGYLNLFDLPNARLFAEGDVLGGLTERQVLDLRGTTRGARLDAAPTLVLVAGGDDLWRVHDQFPMALCRDRSRLTINPIYRHHETGDGLELVLTWPNPYIRQECVAAEAILQKHYRLSREAVRRALEGSDPSQLADLVGRFILVPLPPRYTRGQRVLSRE